MKWTAEATEYFKKVPPFVRPMAKMGVENYAKIHGLFIITPDIIQQAKSVLGHKKKKGKPKNRMNVGKFNRRTAKMNDSMGDFLACEDVDPLKYAFEEKAAVHAGMTGKHLESEQVLPTWYQLAARKDTSPRRTVYLHIPFCRSHCRFCGFYMYRAEEEETARYTNAIIKEIKTGADRVVMQSHPIHAVFFGGGTPSALSADELEQILTTLRTHLPLANDCEITVEGRVEDFSEDKIKACVAGGANRFSIGIQSFNTDVRQTMGRVADRSQALKFLDTLCRQDQAAVVIDLIYGFPGQSMEIWQNDVQTFINETDVDGVDLYQLNIFQGGPLYKAIEKGKIAPAADIATQAEMFAQGREICMEGRLRRLSVAHWARNLRERNRYNTFTRFGSLCFPFGCGAGGRLPGHYFFQEGSLKKYYELVDKNIKPVTTGMVLPENTDLFRELVGNMENLSVNLAALGKKFDLDLPRIFAPLLEQWKKTGLVKLSDSGWLEFTVAGEFWNVTLAQKMLEYFTTTQANRKHSV